MEKIILIKYGELTTKKDNRKFFIDVLEKNIRNLLKDFNLKIIKDRVRMFIETDDIENAALKLTKIFGIHGIAICHKVNSNNEEILNKVLEIIPKDKKTFKIETKRADKNFPIKSMDFNNLVGGHVLKNTEYKVDVHNPEVLVNIEIRKDFTYIYTNTLNGSGGYPVGVQGKGILMLSGGIDSPVAGYLALKRGVDIDCVYFDSPPHTSEEAKNKVIELAKILNEYSGNIRLFVIPFTELQQAIYKNCPNDYMITIMRRMMYRICEKMAKKHKAKILINGESIGQVASQTLSSMVCINEVTNMPVVRPVACLDKLEIIEIAKKIGTYETSILPFEDCCTIFVPKHPVINPNISKAKIYEESFDFEPLIEKCVENAEIITNFEKEKFTDLL